MSGNVNNQTKGHVHRDQGSRGGVGGGGRGSYGGGGGSGIDADGIALRVSSSNKHK